MNKKQEVAKLKNELVDLWSNLKNQIGFLEVTKLVDFRAYKKKLTELESLQN